MSKQFSHKAGQLRALYRAIWVAGTAFTAATSATTAPGMTLPMPASQVQEQVLHAIKQIAPQREEHRRYRMALPFGAPLFPPDADLAIPPVVPALAAWLDLPAERRRYDVLITPDVDYYWSAEGRRYSCQFLVHIEARGIGSEITVTQVHAIEYMGKRVKLLGRSGPGRYLTILPTSPSARSEADLRNFLGSVLNQGL